MRELRIACIVEAPGEVSAVPILIRRLVQEIDASSTTVIPSPPIRIPRSKVEKPGEIERAVKLAAAKLSGSGAILVLMDADDDCPAVLGAKLLQRAQSARADIEIAVVIAKREFEAWFLAAAESLRGRRGLSGTLESPGDPEAIRDAKGWLRKNMQQARTYQETVDQPALTAVFDIAAARRAPSFDKLYREIDRLLGKRPELP
jgi:hypothetical protein